VSSLYKTWKPMQPYKRQLYNHLAYPTIAHCLALDFCRAMLCKRGLCRHAVFVRSSVRLLRSWILSKRINISSNFSPSGRHTILVFPYQTSWQYSDRNPLMGVSNAGDVGTDCDFGQYLIDDCWRQWDQQLTAVRAL